MKKIAALAMIIVASSVGGQEQTEEQKFLMERHKKVMMEPANNRESFVESVEYLLRRRAGVPFVEDRIIAYRTDKTKLLFWSAALDKYRYQIVIEDMPDRMIPELAYQFSELKFSPFNTSIMIRRIQWIAEFGPRGKAFLPPLESIRDNSKDTKAAIAAKDAIAKIQK